jgi:hypothetical protein
MSLNKLKKGGNKMVKITHRDYQKDDPIFSGGVTFFSVKKRKVSVKNTQNKTSGNVKESKKKGV